MTAERVICATCGHAYNGHAHPTVVSAGASLPCNVCRDCEAFVNSGDTAPESRDGHWPNMWELENHAPGGAA